MKITTNHQDTVVSYTQLVCEHRVTPQVLMASNWNKVTLYLFERWWSGSPIFLIVSAVRVKLSRIQQN